MTWSSASSDEGRRAARRHHRLRRRRTRAESEGRRSGTASTGPGITDHRSIEIDDWDPLPYFDNPKEARRADRVEQFALAAAAEAFELAGMPTVESRPLRHDLRDRCRRAAID